MNFNAEQFTAANKATVDSLLAVSNTALASAERILALNMDIARSAIEDSASGAKALLHAKDVNDVVSIQTSLTQPAIEKALDYTRSIYEVAARSQEEMSKLLEAQFGSFQKSVEKMLEQANKSAPKGSENAFSAIQSAISAANAAYGNMNVVAKQFADAAQGNLATATKAAAAATKKAR